MVCVHGTGKLSASSAGQTAPGLFCVSSPESITLTGSQGLLALHTRGQSSLVSAHPDVLLTPRGSVPTFPEPGRTRKLSGLLLERLTLHRAQAMCVAHPYVTGGICLLWIHRQFSNLPSKGRHFGTTVILFYSSKEPKPSLDGDVKVLLQCLEQQMVPSVYAEKSGMNQREEVLTRLVALSIQAGMLVTKETIKVKKTTNTHQGAPYLGKSCDTGTFVFAVVALVQTSVVALVLLYICCIHIWKIPQDNLSGCLFILLTEGNHTLCI